MRFTTGYFFKEVLSVTSGIAKDEHILVEKAKSDKPNSNKMSFDFQCPIYKVLKNAEINEIKHKQCESKNMFFCKNAFVHYHYSDLMANFYK